MLDGFTFKMVLETPESTILEGNGANYATSELWEYFTATLRLLAIVCGERHGNTTRVCSLGGTKYKVPQELAMAELLYV